ncbi:MAG: hypothetical protein DRQ44_03485 [Gammaproteobacteria bacterium]|nr:MAG: hypothetical protein DRQ44_03485 [Gammaproteobacteria bacterium]
MHKPFLAAFFRAIKAMRAQLMFLSSLFYVLSGSSYAAEGISGFEKFRKFEKIYEPSGVVQLPDERFLVVEDEAAHPLAVFSLQPDGQVSEQSIYHSSLLSWSSPNRVLSTLEDLEAVTVDDLGRIYAITSHSRKENGKRADKREQLARFALDGERIVDFKVLRNLRKKISALHESLKDAAKIRDVKNSGGFNIEGLSFDATKQNLLIGLRSPLAGSDAIIMVLENPQAVFEQDEEPQISSRLINLDLHGGGIRALSYDPHLGGFLIISRKPGKSFKLWLWNANMKTKPKRLKVPGIKNLRQAEGVTAVLRDGHPEGILIVSDDGIGLKAKPGHYLFLRYEQLIIN